MIQRHIIKSEGVTIGWLERREHSRNCFMWEVIPRQTKRSMKLTFTLAEAKAFVRNESGSPVKFFPTKSKPRGR